MKKFFYYAGMMIAVIVLLPMLIVKGCGPSTTGKKPPVEEIKEKTYQISVYNTSLNQSLEMDLEEYIKGVLAAEMPADFDMEALKAQATAARTYAYGRLAGIYQSKQGVHDGIDVCTNSAHCQAWTSKENALKKWNIFFASRNWSKIEKAVDSTKGMIVVYNNEIANTLFHASSPGKTENSEEVWSGVSVPYLRSVDSSGEEASKGYITTITLKTSELLEKLRKAHPEAEFTKSILKSMKILNYTTGERVNTLKIGDTLIKGTEFRSLLGLRSAYFKLEWVDNKSDELKITTKGFGHGVGMSQWGADSLAKKGGTYIEILKHYYSGVDVIPIVEYEQNR